MNLTYIVVQGYVCSGVEGVDVGKLLNASIARYKDMNIEVSQSAVRVRVRVRVRVSHSHSHSHILNDSVKSFHRRI